MQIDWRAVGLGMVAAVGIAVPLALVYQLLRDSYTSTLLQVVFLVLVLAGLAIGGFIAGWKGPIAPLTHGILAALAAYVLLQVVTLVLLVARSEDLDFNTLAGIVFNAGLAAGMGLLGGWIANWRATRSVAGRQA
jgi:hypothetical protein